MIRKASAVWQGDLKSGKGTMTAPSGVMTNAAYSFATRFEEAPGTNPEELIAAAHAGCFSMALSAELGKAGLTPERVATVAAVTLETVDGKPTVTKSHLTVRAKVPGADNAKFLEIAGGAKAGCPISRLLKAEITMDAALEG
ncbi:MAG: OsmC family protein [Candidatus Eisenbacteria bacterium]|uniref:OsmC family protein n=1 Tax=Eiseniibacteriota bacterium TaxID=2212470 RepID=A0A538U4A8_UNCEI|nr:MAG: OsmC family protein [Candidatus Eisenbacteria bacterium]